MARTYRRDSNGRFSSGGGGGGRKSGGGKAAGTRAANTARAGELKAKGTTGLGGRVKAKGFSGGKAAQQRAGGLRGSNAKAPRAAGVSAPKGTIARGSVNRSIAATRGQGGGTTVSARSAAPASSGRKAPAKMGKKAANPAQQKYKAATSQMRELKMYRGGKTDKAVKAAAAKVKRMESKRMAGGGRKRKG